MTDNRTHTKPPRPEPTTLERTRDAAADAARRTGDAIEANPLGIVVGGLAVGALIGALLPRSEKEKELLAPVGKRLGDTARAAVETAKSQGLAELENRGFTRDAAREQVKNVIGGLGAAVTSAGSAAGKAATGKATGHDEGQA